MKQRIKIKVQVPDYSHNGQFKVLYSNCIDVDDSVNFDYSLVLKSLKMLYPFDNSFISFVVS